MMISIFAHHELAAVWTSGFTAGNAFEVRLPGSAIHADAETVIEPLFFTFIHLSSVFGVRLTGNSRIVRFPLAQ